MNIPEALLHLYDKHSVSYLFLLEFLLFSGFIWALQFWFRKTNEVSRWELHFIKASGIVFVLAHLACAALYLNENKVVLLIGVSLLIGSGLLFVWTLASFRQRPAVAFADEITADLKTDGPYKFIRNPFYSSYLMAWLGGSLATGIYPLAFSFVLMCFIYFGASKLEEYQWLRSGSRSKYIQYLSNTGSFFPRFQFTNSLSVTGILLTEAHEFEEYRLNYLKLAKSEIPEEYLKTRSVYGFYQKGKMVAGFIVGTEAPFRTFELFASEASKSDLITKFSDGKDLCEVCCFWSGRKGLHFLASTSIWISMAVKVMRTRRKFFLGGTYARGLANIYGCPTYAHLILRDKVDGKDSWIFIAWTKFAMLSAIQVMGYKVRKMIFGNRWRHDYTTPSGQDLKAVFEEIRR